MGVASRQDHVICDYCGGGRLMQFPDDRASVEMIMFLLLAATAILIALLWVLSLVYALLELRHSKGAAARIPHFASKSILKA
jgi:hypothetical protein